MALAGLWVPVQLNLVFLVEGVRRADYSMRADYLSELSLGAHGWIQRSNFIIGGLLFLVFGYALLEAFRGSRPLRAGARFVMGMAGALVIAGVFNTDPFPRGAATLGGMVHDAAAAACFSSMTAALFLYARGLRDLDGWESVAKLTSVCAVVTLTTFLLVIVGFELPYKPAPMVLQEQVGLLQRLSQLSFFVAFLFVARRLARTPSLPVVETQ